MTGIDWLWSRPVVIGLAVLGALLSTAASMLQTRGRISEAHAAKVNLAGYVVMGVSMALFAVAGLLGGNGT